MSATATERLAVSIVVPVFRSERTLRTLFDRVSRTMAGTEGGWEIVFVDDASPDGSWRVLEDLQRAHPDRVSAVRLARNFGQHNALMCGFHEARGDVVVTMDDDLQNPPEEVPKLLAALGNSELDVVYGRYGTKKHRPWRNGGSWMINVFYRRVFGNKITVTSYRAVRRDTLANILTYDLNFTFIDGLLAWNTQRIGVVDVEHHARSEGRSGYTLARLATLAFNLFTNFSLLPLQIVSAMGLALAGSGFLVGLWYLVAYFRNRIVVPGYASTITAILVLGGAQLVALGMIGEYLGRLHLNVNRKPQFAVRTRLGPPRGDHPFRATRNTPATDRSSSESARSD
jgi:glycosyltransferase involved in cell wall biosynthesis